MPKEPSQHETTIFNAVAALLNARITPHDDGSLAGMYDATIEYSDGRQAALEVTRVIHPNELKLESISERTIALRGVDDWLLWYPTTVEIRDIRRHGPALVALCESAGVVDPMKLFDRYLPATLPPELVWLVGHQLRLERIGPNPQGTGGELYVSPQGFGGAIRRDLAGLGEWVTEQTSARWFVQNTAKLAASGLDEQHLAVSLHASGVPDDLLISFMRAETIVAPELQNAGTLSDLWLFPVVSTKLVHWSTRGGWRLLDWPPEPQ